MPRSLLLDLFNTLVPGGTDAYRRTVTLAIGETLGVDPLAYADAFRATYPQRFVGGLGGETGCLRTIAHRVGGSPSDAQVARAAAMRRRMTARLIRQAPAETLAVLDKLRADRWRLGLVSNSTAESPVLFRRSPLADRFDTVAFSSELGVAKPDPAIYLAACQTLRADPASCWYVGDGADQELATAARLGMHAIRTTEHANSDPHWPGPTIGTLADLPTHLG